jgi:hypothetical protein
MGLAVPFELRQTLVVGVLNGALAIPAYALLDRLRQDVDAPIRVID